MGVNLWIVLTLPGIELPGGVPPTYPLGMCGAAKEIGHRVVGGGAGGVIGPAYVVEVGLEPVAGLELGEGASVRPGQQLSGWVNWGGGSPLSSSLVIGFWLRNNCPAPALGQRWGRGVGVITSYSRGFLFRGTLFYKKY